MLEFKELSLQVGDKVLLSTASVRLEDHYRVGLVGRNGSGKSSLIKLLLGQLSADMTVTNTIVRHDIGYLEQNLPEGELTAIEFAKTGDWRWLQVQHDLREAEIAEDGEKIALGFVRLQEIDGYTIEARAAKILNGLGFTSAQFELPVKSFSGGWQMRLQLAKVLLSNADMLLLDEPTNHLDIDAIIWLAGWLKQCRAMQIIISHDRDFLDDVCTHTLHLANQALKLYDGNYTQFQKQYAEARLVDERTRKKTEAKRAHMEAFVNRFKAKASKAKQAQSRMKALEKLEVSVMAQEEGVYQFNFSSDIPLTGPLLTLQGEVGYPENSLLENLNFSLYQADRVGIVGRNGMGKTTLLNTLAQQQHLLSGEIFISSKLKVGYYAQNQAERFHAESSPLAIVMEQEKSFGEKQARAFLGRIGFSGDRVHEPIAQFSGGERSRLALALLSNKKPHLLILDEPTNHLDLESKEALILALLDFSGALIVVSHDRYFMTSVTNQIFYLYDKKLHQLEGSDWHELEEQLLQADKPTVAKAPASKLKKKQSGSPKQAEKIEQQLHRKAQAIIQIEKEMVALSSLPDLLNNPDYQKLSQHHVALKQEIEALEAKWLEENDS